MKLKSFGASYDLKREAVEDLTLCSKILSFQAIQKSLQVMPSTFSPGQNNNFFNVQCL
jgi:hypothetical protein